MYKEYRPSVAVQYEQHILQWSEKMKRKKSEKILQVGGKWGNKSSLAWALSSVIGLFGPCTHLSTICLFMPLILGEDEVLV